MTSILAVGLLVVYAALTQWAFRCQRVGRGILLLTHDSAAAHADLLSSILPRRFVTAVWAKRAVWISCACFAWVSWRWWGLGALLAGEILIIAVLEPMCPWPSHAEMLQLIKRHITSGRPGVEAVLLLPTLEALEEHVASGGDFEKATCGVWLRRPSEALRAIHDRETASSRGTEDQHE